MDAPVFPSYKFIEDAYPKMAYTLKDVENQIFHELDFFASLSSEELHDSPIQLTTMGKSIIRFGTQMLSNFSNVKPLPDTVYCVSKPAGKGSGEGLMTALYRRATGAKTDIVFINTLKQHLQSLANACLHLHQYSNNTTLSQALTKKIDQCCAGLACQGDLYKRIYSIQFTAGNIFYAAGDDDYKAYYTMLADINTEFKKIQTQISNPR